MRFSGGADIAAVEQQPVVGTGYVFLGKVLNKLFFNRFRSLCRFWDQSKAVRDAEDMCIYRHSGQHHIGSFSPYAWQLGQVIDVARNLASEIHDHHLRHLQ